MITTSDLNFKINDNQKLPQDTEISQHNNLNMNVLSMHKRDETLAIQSIRIEQTNINM